MDVQEFTNLYTKQKSDETVTSFQNENGFSLIRLYPENTSYRTDGRRMFIKIAVLDKGLFYGVDMTKPKKEEKNDSYLLTDGEEYKKKVTNFVSDTGDNEFIFDEVRKEIKHNETGKYFTLNEFVEILAKNHLSDRLYWKRNLNTLNNALLKIIFWLSDKRYEKTQISIDKYHWKRDNKPAIDDEKNIEPFFKYFYISKNFIFTMLLIAFLVAIVVAIFPKEIPIKDIWLSLFGGFSLSNPLVVLLFFLTLFSSEKLSVWLNNNIKDFLMPDKSHFSKKKDNFIEKLHNYQYHNKFNLKL